MWCLFCNLRIAFGIELPTSISITKNIMCTLSDFDQFEACNCIPNVLLHPIDDIIQSHIRFLFGPEPSSTLVVCPAMNIHEHCHRHRRIDCLALGPVDSLSLDALTHSRHCAAGSCAPGRRRSPNSVQCQQPSVPVGFLAIFHLFIRFRLAFKKTVHRRIYG